MSIKNKSIILSLVLIGVLISATGCYDLDGGLVFNEAGETEVFVSVDADEIMGGEEARILAWQIEFLFPEIDLNYEKSMEVTQINYQDYLRIDFTREDLINLKDSSYFDFTEENGSYEFNAVIPAVIDEPSEDTKDDIVLNFFVELPANIDMANTTNVDGNIATWRLTKSDLANGISLRAFTE